MGPHSHPDFGNQHLSHPGSRRRGGRGPRRVPSPQGRLHQGRWLQEPLGREIIQPRPRCSRQTARSRGRRSRAGDAGVGATEPSPGFPNPGRRPPARVRPPDPVSASFPNLVAPSRRLCLCLPASPAPPPGPSENGREACGFSTSVSTALLFCLLVVFIILIGTVALFDFAKSKKTKYKNTRTSGCSCLCSRKRIICRGVRFGVITSIRLFEPRG